METRKNNIMNIDSFDDELCFGFTDELYFSKQISLTNASMTTNVHSI